LKKVRVGLIGCGGIALANHVPGLRLCPQAQLVALCDNNPVMLAQASRATGIEPENLYTDYLALIRRVDLDAVIITTPNFTHAPIAIAAAKAGKHVLCEKPLALNPAEALAMLQAAQANNVRHMTAFTYRFVPAMRYMHHLVTQGYLGQPFHFRANRFQDWGKRALGWRQVKELAGTGELGDMLSHRLDYAHLLIGSLERLVARTHAFYSERDGQLSDVDEWVAVLAEFAGGVTGVWESSKLATGRGEGANSLDLCEVNGSEGTLVYSLSYPKELLMGKPGGRELERVKVPPEFLVYPGSPRDPQQGDPLITFRYDQNYEFIDAILNQRECRPSFADGLSVQLVMQAIFASAQEQRWVEPDYAFGDSVLPTLTTQETSPGHPAPPAI
jgi:predicted dehydrogenase